MYFMLIIQIKDAKGLLAKMRHITHVLLLTCEIIIGSLLFAINLRDVCLEMYCFAHLTTMLSHNILIISSTGPDIVKLCNAM